MNWPVSFQASLPTAPESSRNASAVPSMVPSAPSPKAPSIVFPASRTVLRSTFRRTSTIAAFTQMFPSW